MQCFSSHDARSQLPFCTTTAAKLPTNFFERVDCLVAEALCSRLAVWNLVHNVQLVLGKRWASFSSSVSTARHGGGHDQLCRSHQLWSVSCPSSGAPASNLLRPCIGMRLLLFDGAQGGKQERRSMVPRLFAFDWNVWEHLSLHDSLMKRREQCLCCISARCAITALTAVWRAACGMRIGGGGGAWVAVAAWRS